MKIHLFPCGIRIGGLIIKVYRELVCFGCFFVSGMSCAYPVWEFINEIEKIVGKKHIQIDVSESPLKNPIKRKKWKKN